MIIQLVQLVSPVFLIVGLGYICARIKLIDDNGIDGILKFAQSIAIPIYLFLGILKLDLQVFFNLNILLSYYIGSFFCFIFGFMLSRLLFDCTKGESISIGFCIMFPNLVLLGMPITELAYGKDAINTNLSIIAVNAPFCYLIGITCMEMFGKENVNLRQTANSIFYSIFSNPIAFSVLVGLAFNFLSFELITPFENMFSLMSIGALPIALFGLGGILIRYQFSNEVGKVSMVVLLTLLVHPMISFCIGFFYTNLDVTILRSAIICAAMGPGLNAFLFANYYKDGRETVAAAVLICTPITMFTTPVWIQIIEFVY